MKKLILTLSVFFSLTASPQKGITFSVEDLSKPEKLLHTLPVNGIYENLILSDAGLSKYEIRNDSVGFPFGIIAQSQLSDSLVYVGYHSFFNGMYQAYADHRPFVLSPDMIWLLISQGFARHVSANSEQLRHHFVDFSGKLSLVVPVNDMITLDNPQSPWEAVFPEFTKQIGEHAGKDLISLLSSDFSTSTPITKMASEVTIMEAMEPYFEYVIIRIVCGIPEITLKGTPDDWQKILDKTKQLSHYDLQWWTKELIPILEEFVNASEGKADKKFWQNMFKYHSQKEYGAPKMIDGWIVKFFPYDKKGKRNNLDKLEGGNNLPEEIVKVNLMFVDTETEISTPLELWAGFVGLEQNTNNYALTPQIGWMIRKKDVDKAALKKKLESDSRSDWGRISIRVKEIPSAVFELKKIQNLNIEFIDTIVVPDELAKVQIKRLTLSGKISQSEIERVCQLFPNSQVIINKDVIKKP